MQKRALYIFFGLALWTGMFLAQIPSYQQLVSIIQQKSPNLDVSDKIIAFNLWSSADLPSRDANRQFEKVAYTFHYARLKNGTKGTVVISCSADDRTTAAIAFQKDAIRNSIPISREDYSFLSNLNIGTNIVYDNTRQKIYENLATNNIFKSYNQLITR